MEKWSGIRIRCTTTNVGLYAINSAIMSGHSNDALNSSVLNSRRNSKYVVDDILTDDRMMTAMHYSFQARAVATGKSRSPTVCRVKARL